VTENHVGAEAREGREAERFIDSVGVGCYRIDLHPSTGGDNYIDISSLPFQIPLGALVPVRVENLLRRARTLAARTSPTAAIACTPSSGISARPPACWRRTVCHMPCRPALFARTGDGGGFTRPCSKHKVSSWPGRHTSPV